MSVEVGVFEAKTRLSELVELVSQSGQEVLITRRGRPAARLVPLPHPGSAVEDALALLHATRAASTPGSAPLRDLIDDGRSR